MDKFPDFDPLVYLGIKDLKGKEKKEVSKKLIDKLSQYFLIRMVEELNDVQLKGIKDPEKLILVAKSKIPDFDAKVRQYLEDFKTEFYKNLKQ